MGVSVQDRLNRAFVTFLVVLFGMSTWVTINGLWVELPLLVALGIPEGYNLASYLVIIIQLANIAPLVYAVACHFVHGNKLEVPSIYLGLAIGAISCLLLVFFWDVTTFWGVVGQERSTALLCLAFFLALKDTTSSVTFIPFMVRLDSPYMLWFFVGQGLSSLGPSLLALAQGVSNEVCVANTTYIDEVTGENCTTWMAEISPANYPPVSFFWLLFALMLVSMVAFFILHALALARKEYIIRPEPPPPSPVPSTRRRSISETIRDFASRLSISSAKETEDDCFEANPPTPKPMARRKSVSDVVKVYATKLAMSTSDDMDGQDVDEAAVAAGSLKRRKSLSDLARDYTTNLAGSSAVDIDGPYVHECFDEIRSNTESKYRRKSVSSSSLKLHPKKYSISSCPDESDPTKSTEILDEHKLGTETLDGRRLSRFSSIALEGKAVRPKREYVLLFVILAIVNTMRNGVLPSIQSYSCGAYGFNAYLLASTLGHVANPVGCFIVLFFPRKNLVLVTGTCMVAMLAGCYCLTTAALSPTPPLQHDMAGTVIVVIAWVLVSGLFAHIKSTIGWILRHEPDNHKLLRWYGIVTQLGSLIGALVMFPLVNFFPLFTAYHNDPCAGYPTCE